MKKLSQGIIAAVLIVTLTACTGLGVSSHARYTISYSTVDSEPVYIEKVKFDKNNVMPGGILMGGRKRAMGMICLFPPPPVPNQVYIYWFNYRQQVFYEATVHIQNNAAKVMHDLPQLKFSGNFLVTGVKPDGTAVVWVTNGSNAKFSTWVEVGRAKGERVAGDVENFRDQTEGMRKRGEI